MSVSDQDRSLVSREICRELLTNQITVRESDKPGRFSNRNSVAGLGVGGAGGGGGGRKVRKPE